MRFQLIASDMDGTLLRSDHSIPEEFWPLLDKLQAQGVVFAPASGRQLYTLLDMFDQAPKQVSVLAENGTVVFHNGEIISATTVNPEAARRVVDAIESHPEIRWEVIVCRTDGAFVRQDKQEFMELAAQYYKRLTPVEKLQPYINNDVIKLALFMDVDPETVAAPILREAAQGELTTTISSAMCIDMMHPSANKGEALRQLAAALNIPLSETAAFGDYLNDSEMLDVAGTSYAVANAHPDLQAAADHVIPANTEQGVIQTLRELVKD